VGELEEPEHRRIGANLCHHQIHNRMPAILEPRSYNRWLSSEPDPHALLITYPSEPMTMWPISTRVNKPENDDQSLLDRVAERSDWQAPLQRRGEAESV
jgi:putative SOS response-associated peptidase YedK